MDRGLMFRAGIEHSYPLADGRSRRVDQMERGGDKRAGRQEAHRRDGWQGHGSAGEWRLSGAIDAPMPWANPNIKSGLEVIDMTEVGTPEDGSGAIDSLPSPQADFVQGAALSVDGGHLGRLRRGNGRRTRGIECRMNPPPTRRQP